MGSCIGMRVDESKLTSIFRSTNYNAKVMWKSCCGLQESEAGDRKKSQSHPCSSAKNDAATWDCIVIGAGIIGSSTAYHLARNGMITLLLEQFFLPHTRGSSHGQSRVLRQAYADNFYAAMLPEAYGLWEQFERESGKSLCRHTGMLLVADVGSEVLKKTRDLMDEHNMPYEELTSAEVQTRFPGFKPPTEFSAMFDLSAGILIPDRCMAVIQALLQACGATLKDGETVVAVRPENDIVVVESDKEVYFSHKVVLTPGAWASGLLKKTGLDVPIEMVPSTLCYWKEATPGSYSAKNDFPVIVYQQTQPVRREYTMYPCLEYPGLVKLDTTGHDLVRGPHSVDPDERDNVQPPKDINVLQDYVKRTFPQLGDGPDIVESCIYSMTPDRHFIIDFHPNSKNVLIGVGFSGHGYKMAPVIGKLLWQMASDQRPSYDIKPFSLSRFANNCVVSTNS